MVKNAKKKQLIGRIKKALKQEAEDSGLEFKDGRGGPPQHLYEVISAFSNTPGGGVVVFGVKQDPKSRKFSVVGGLDLDTLQEKIVSFIQEKMICSGKFSLEVEEMESNQLLILPIEESPREEKPCYYEPLGLPRGAFVRVGNTNRRITDDEMRAFLRYSPTYKFDRTRVQDATVDMLSNKKIDEFLRKSAERTKRSFPDNMSQEKVMKNLGIIEDFDGELVPTLAGYLIFASADPQQLGSCARYIIRCVKYAGTTASSQIIDRHDVAGTLDEQIDDAMKFILRNIALRARVVGTKRIDEYEYPEDALREVLANAVIHRDYSVSGTYAHVQIFADRIEVSNPGTLPPGVTVVNLKVSQFSRNEVIANTMRGLAYIEEFGRGIDLIYARMSESKLVEPLFKNSSNMFKVTLLGERFKELNERQIKIWYYLQDYSQITASYAHNKLFPGVSRVTVNNDLRKMVELEQIQIRGSSSSTYYEPKY